MPQPKDNTALPTPEEKEEGKEEGQKIEEEEKGEEEEGEKVEIGGKEYPVDKVTNLLEKGQEYEKLKEEYPEIDFKEMPKEFTKRSQKLAEIDKKKDSEKDFYNLGEEGKEEEKVEEKKEEVKPEEADKTRQAQVQYLIDLGFVTKEQAEKMSDMKTKGLEEKEQLARELTRLEYEYDGSDGRPQFKRDEVLEHCKKRGIWNPEVAYKDKYETEIDDWKRKETTSKKKPTFAEKPSGSGVQLPKGKKLETFEDAEKATEELISNADKE